MFGILVFERILVFELRRRLEAGLSIVIINNIGQRKVEARPGALRKLARKAARPKGSLPGSVQR
jgi:hypothetical protein